MNNKKSVVAFDLSELDLLDSDGLGALVTGFNFELDALTLGE
jgi:anti-anti-sigma regulatory factor